MYAMALRLLEKYSSWGRVFVLTLILISTMIFSSAIDSPRGNFGHSPPVWVGLEKRSADDIYHALESYGALGRQKISQVIILDVFYAFIWSGLLGFVIYLAYHNSRLRKHRKLTGAVVLIPFAGLIIDQLQNINILIILEQYPSRSTGLAELSSYLTIGLWLLILASIIAAAVGLTFLLVEKLANKKLAAN